MQLLSRSGTCKLDIWPRNGCILLKEKCKTKNGGKKVLIKLEISSEWFIRFFLIVLNSRLWMSKLSVYKCRLFTISIICAKEQSSRICSGIAEFANYRPQKPVSELFSLAGTKCVRRLLHVWWISDCGGEASVRALSRRQSCYAFSIKRSFFRRKEKVKKARAKPARKSQPWNVLVGKSVRFYFNKINPRLGFLISFTDFSVFRKHKKKMK